MNLQRKNLRTRKTKKAHTKMKERNSKIIVIWIKREKALTVSLEKMIVIKPKTKFNSREILGLEKRWAVRVGIKTVKRVGREKLMVKKVRWRKPKGQKEKKTNKDNEENK
ncbi:hypothetical protein Nepgr_016546 [Nepenthes gracilis]|uniref:Uncharacterized protein n=1 Tax=Nepenthes gracilis TaxID=150966 RepID=A0AAD3SMW5_NEPGR|nr:hypothetical protein Nepgr_016546 [Nepenthes gracilis]